MAKHPVVDGVNNRLCAQTAAAGWRTVGSVEDQGQPIGQRGVVRAVSDGLLGFLIPRGTLIFPKSMTYLQCLSLG